MSTVSSDAAAAPGRRLRVALVCMPFSAADRPSIQIGLLAAIAREAGVAVDTFHLNLELAARIPDAYEGLCSHRGRMTGEWLFSVAAFGEAAPRDDQAFFEAFPEELGWAAKGGKDAAYLSWLRHTALPAFVDDCLAMADWGSYDVVGFTSTFQQNAASLALARRIKERHAHVRTVFGGANMEDTMGAEYARAFPYVDFVATGEADESFPLLLARLEAGEARPLVPGVWTAGPGGPQFGGPATPFTAMDSLPVPDYAEYFDRVRGLELRHQAQWIFALPFESSRGCWWGQKHHCTFCGLNGQGMGFRAKSPQRVLAELDTLALRHHVTMFQATDNIMDMSYVRDFFALIERSRTDFQFFYEVKSNLTKDQLRTLRRGGVRWLQPGIESLSTHVLKLMHKGCSMLQNVRLLKWANYYRMRVGWNLLWGFPGEQQADYDGELAVLRLLTHLEPPNASGRIWIERFAPVFFDRVRFPAAVVRPEPSYGHVYPPGLDLSKVAYFFEGELDDTLPDEAHAATVAHVRDWKAAWESQRPPSLSYRRTRDAILVDDDRGEAFRGTHVFHGPAALAYEHCGDSIRTAEEVRAQLADGGAAYDTAEVTGLLDEFCRRGLMVAEDGRYLSLALPANQNW